jgi:hypothetical protein
MPSNNDRPIVRWLPVIGLIALVIIGESGLLDHAPAWVRYKGPWAWVAGGFILLGYILVEVLLARRSSKANSDPTRFDECEECEYE